MKKRSGLVLVCIVFIDYFHESYYEIVNKLFEMLLAP